MQGKPLFDTKERRGGGGEALERAGVRLLEE